ncbi:PERQ amino acid-rich with GYF domain-containing protein 2-like isoform X3 [Sinocyclocheilus rhinocerous]|uniref:PERQ amino acid-rich with GYF domain-containing protein 2-like isoform X3 n=1 Tax=Sinocyclocheilus rhinocerous TaxID=307959 RepID=UPI0007B8CC36|nr:PREDICTED: PERQ amino acid-rich with GYF domain-containing protein 2-like isoform X3 [Sinocyclocheilus rhinocerous]
MAETQTLNFGPEWLRALSGGVGSSSVTSPPLSPALPKYKLADYRYGREEMLALYVKDDMIPVDLHDKEFLPILQEEPLPPLALVPFTEEEQRNFSMSINSAAVLRLTGRGGGTVAGAPRGRSSSRGRGRGRGDGGFYQRSFDDVEGGFGRGGREMHRSQSWEERGDRRFEKPGRKDPDGAPANFPLNHIRPNYEDAGAGNARKNEFIRSESDNWRMSRDEQNGEDDDGGWRIAGSRRDNERWCPPSPDGPRSAGWREHPDQRRRFPFDSRGEDGGYRRPQSGSGSLEEERDSLPEWCLEDAEEETGTFDSSGAFLSLKKAPKEPILEEAELDFQPLEENEECTEKDDSESEQTKDTDTESSRRESDRNEEGSKSEEPSPVAEPFPAVVTLPKAVTPAPLPSVHSEPAVESERPLERTTVTELRPELSKAPLHTTLPNSIVEAISIPHVTNTIPDLPVPTPSVLPIQSVPTQTQQVKPLEMPVAVAPVLPHSMGIVGSISRPSALPSDMDEDEGLKHFEQEAEKMVAYLQDGGVDDERLATKIGRKPTALTITHEAAFKWFYKDPQGEIQGPFNNQEMSEWFQAGYFTMTLQVKRGCDEMFQPLGEMMKLWGRVPFTPGPTLPPILGDEDQERMKRQQEINVLNMYQLQQLQYQYLLRQQYALAQQKVLSSAPPPQQQQLNLLLHQALKIRTPELQQSLLPPVTRSMSVPDSGSVWEMQNPSTEASCSPNMQPSTPSTWEGSSVWDLPLDSMPQASSIEQMQMEKAKALKLEMEKREVALRAKRKEEERKRLEEALHARQEEERKRLEEEELARRKQEEALQRQRDQEEAQQWKKEEEERLAQEEALRRLEEKRREEEERRQREEFLRKHQEEERRKQEELEAQRRLEEEEAAAAALERQQQEEQKRNEQEAQRQQELQRQRQQQQEEQKRNEQEAQRQQELQRQRQQQQEALRRLQQQQQQQQLAQMKLPSSSKWGQQSTTASTLSQSQNALSLAEIQKLEEERERQTLEEQRRQLQEFQRAQQQQPQAKLSGWGNVTKQPAATKSLLEIQREEAQQMKQRKEQQQQQPQQQPQQQHQQQNSTVTQQKSTQNRVAPNSSVWGSVNNVGYNWMMDSSSVWGDAQNSNIGFWDEAVKEATPPQATRKSHNQKNKDNANLSNSSSGKASKKVEEEEKLLKLFQGANKNQDGFMQWCEQTLHTLNTANNLDVPTFASFLKEVDSPYEVHDYVRAYLGDTPQAKDFAKQFLERRAKQNANQQKPQQGQQQKQQDSVWGLSQVSQSVLHQQQQQQRFETVTSGKKKKKQKMVRADPSLLGFSVNASSERLNMGEIESVEDI